MNRSQRILIPSAAGVVLMAIVLLGGYAMFGDGPLWFVWPYISIGFGLWVGFTVHTAISGHASTALATGDHSSTAIE